MLIVGNAPIIQWNATFLPTLGLSCRPMHSVKHAYHNEVDQVLPFDRIVTR